MKSVITFITGAFIAILMSCTNGKQATKTDTGKETVVTADALYGPKWLLTKIHQDNQVRDVTAGKAFIRFNREEGSAGGNGSCNSFGSTLKADGNAITMTDIFSTKMYCDAVQSIEDSFFKQLAKVTRFEIKGTTLLLYEKDTVVLEFQKGEEKPNNA